LNNEEEPVIKADELFGLPFRVAKGFPVFSFVSAAAITVKSYTAASRLFRL
jgi:hypothetical protein